MTGKEALITLSKTCKAYELEVGSLKIDKTDNEALQVLRQIVQKHDKYKRAFEILKEKLNIDSYRVAPNYRICFEEKDYKTEISFLVNKEQYELLEELINDKSK